jgi:hypothetical protein
LRGSKGSKRPLARFDLYSALCWFGGSRIRTSMLRCICARRTVSQSSGSVCLSSSSFDMLLSVPHACFDFCFWKSNNELETRNLIRHRINPSYLIKCNSTEI